MFRKKRGEIPNGEDTYFCLTRMPEGEFLLARDLYAEQGNSRARYVGEILGQLHLIMKDMEEQEEYQEDDLLACIKGWRCRRAQGDGTARRILH